QLGRAAGMPNSMVAGDIASLSTTTAILLSTRALSSCRVAELHYPALLVISWLLLNPFPHGLDSCIRNEDGESALPLGAG
ncbi:hypothetical protein K0M31_001034, partial [Melipona bicolor]